MHAHQSPAGVPRFEDVEVDLATGTIVLMALEALELIRAAQAVCGSRSDHKVDMQCSGCKAETARFLVTIRWDIRVGGGR